MDELTAERFGWVIPYVELDTRPSRGPRSRVRSDAPPWVIEARRAVLCGVDQDPVMDAIAQERRLVSAIRAWGPMEHRAPRRPE